MAKFKGIIFDLDGTLLDTIEDIADSMNNVIKRFGYRPQGIEDYKIYVGDGVENLVKRVTKRADIGRLESLEIIKQFKKEYNKRWNLKTKPYVNIMKILQLLKEKDVKMAVLSNKPDYFTKIMVKYYFPHIKFRKVVGEKRGYPIKPDPFFAIQIAKDLNISPDFFVYLGDTGTDMQTAIQAGMFPVGALWGFRDKDELLAGGAKLLISDPIEVIELFD